MKALQVLEKDMKLIRNFDGDNFNFDVAGSLESARGKMTIQD